MTNTTGLLTLQPLMWLSKHWRGSAASAWRVPLSIPECTGELIRTSVGRLASVAYLRGRMTLLVLVHWRILLLWPKLAWVHVTPPGTRRLPKHLFNVAPWAKRVSFYFELHLLFEAKSESANPKQSREAISAMQIHISAILTNWLLVFKDLRMKCAVIFYI